MRTVSLMGSTGSIGTQALDVMRGEPERFRVHALAAHRSAAQLVAQAAEFRPAVVVIGEPGLYAEVRDGVPAGTEVLVGTEGMADAATRRGRRAQRGGRLRRPPRDDGRAGGGQAPGTGQQGIAHRRRAGRAEGATHARRGDRPRRFGALRAAPVPGLAAGDDRRGPAAPHRLGRPLPGLAGRPSRHGHGGRRAGAPDMVDGTEDHHRLVDTDEQGPRGDRGARAVRSRLRPDRDRRAPPVGRPLHGGAA